MYFISCHVKDKSESERLIKSINVHLKTTDDIANAKGIIILGGDGTVLKTLLSCQSEETPPIYAINYGSLGALTLFKPDELTAVIYSIQAEKNNFNFLTRKRLYLNKIKYFLNEVVFTSSMPGRLNKFEIYIDDIFYDTLMGDSIIISSSSGSSAYNLSAGGPYIDLSCDCIILTVVSPFKSHLKSAVFGINRKIRVESVGDFCVIIDGCETIKQNFIEVLHKPNELKFAYFDSEIEIEKRIYKKIFN